MPEWNIEFDEALVEQLERADELAVDQAVVIRNILKGGGPDALGATAMDIEGLPPWEALGSVVSLKLPNPFDAMRVLWLEIYPGQRAIIVSLG